MVAWIAASDSSWYSYNHQDHTLAILLTSQPRHKRIKHWMRRATAYLSVLSERVGLVEDDQLVGRDGVTASVKRW